jgi:methylmalonyl-CoA mutase
VSFVTNLLAAGGIRAEVGTGTNEQILGAFREGPNRVAVLCSSNALYVEESGQAAQLAPRLKRAGASQLLVAASPDVLDGAGAADLVDGYVYRGVDVVEALTEMLAALAVRS